MPIPPEYRKFLEEEMLARKLSFYERFCKIFSFVKLPIPKFLEEKYRKELEFCHLQITPAEVFSSSILFPTILIFLASILYSLQVLSLEYFLMILFTSGILFYTLYKHTEYLTFIFRTKSASEMVLSIIYMVVSLRIYGNLEMAIVFTAKNLTSPLGKDFKKALWDMYTGRTLTALEALDDLSRKWELESKEFSDALSLIKSSQLSEAEREKNLDEATRIILYGTVDRMKSYAREMKTPISIINMFGILLPLLGLVLFPVVMLLFPEVAKPTIVAFMYDVVLFLIVYLMIRQHCYRRPYSLHKPQLTKVESIAKWKKISIVISFLLGLPVLPVLYFLFSPKLPIFNEFQFLLSLLFTVISALPFVVYNFLVYRKSSKKNLDVVKVEEELSTAMFQLSTELRSGKPVESAVASCLDKMRTLKIRDFFARILTNITQFGMSFRDAIFDNRIGVIREYPSKTIDSVMSLVSEISGKSSLFLSDALENISKYLNGIRSVDEETKNIFEEVTYDIQIQSLVVAPLVAGIVVGLTVFTLSIFFYLGGSLESVEKYFGSLGSAGSLASIGMFNIFNFSKMVPVPHLQMIVGVYLLEVTFLMAYFYGEINYGDDEVSKSFAMAKTLLIVIVLYTAIVLGIYYGIKSFINLEEFAKTVPV